MFHFHSVRKCRVKTQLYALKSLVFKTRTSLIILETLKVEFGVSFCYAAGKTGTVMKLRRFMVFPEVSKLHTFLYLINQMEVQISNLYKMASLDVRRNMFFWIEVRVKICCWGWAKIVLHVRFLSTADSWQVSVCSFCRQIIENIEIFCQFLYSNVFSDWNGKIQKPSPNRSRSTISRQTKRCLCNRNETKHCYLPRKETSKSF